MSAIADRVATIRERIAASAARAGRNPADVRLLAVSKGHPVEAVREAAAAGCDRFGENYLHELVLKAELVPAHWHYQGALQRRKIRDIVSHAESILSVSRAEELAEIQKRAARVIECHIEVNIGGESSKGGAAPEGVASLLAAAAPLDRVRVVELMTIPPPDAEPRRWFSSLRELAERHGLQELSMGMSSDFEEAIAEGSTMVRIGTAIFGERPPRS